MSIKKILAYTFAIIALVFEGFFGIIPFVSFLIQVILIACGVYLLVSLFRRNNMHSWKTAITRYILSILTTVGFFTSIFLVWITYHNQIPGVISDITLTNSGQTVVFLEMSHIATPDFFAEKQKAIQSLSASGYTILFEGVKPGTPENQAIFNQSMGFDFTPTLYSNIADLIGLASQDNQALFAGIATGSLVSVDLSIDDIVKLMDTGSTNTGSIENIESAIKIAIERLSSQERIFIGWIARGFLNWSLKQSEDISTMLTTGTRTKLFEVIIDRRNDRIVEYIVSHPKQKIAVVYGALHFNGVYEALQKKDKNWKTVNMKNSTPYTR